MQKQTSLYEAILALTSASPGDDLVEQASLFTRELDWRPTDFVGAPLGPTVASGHLVVEHGLQHAAVVTFLQAPFQQIDVSDQRKLLGVSYNSLIDWSVFVSRSDVSYVYNRTSPFYVARNQAIGQGSVDILRRSSFEKVAVDRPSPTLLALDEALVRTISEWRRTLAALLSVDIPLEALSALFNALILVRASEDHSRARRESPRESGANGHSEFRTVRSFSPGLQSRLGSVLAEYLEASRGVQVPKFLVDHDLLRVFDGVDGAVARSLVADFYANRFAPYEYDFSLISKHALSKIYEHYVSTLRVVESTQSSLFPEIPLEDLDRAYGSVYTPLFLARFFARIVERLRPHALFGDLKIIDPACGSGIFLRTLLELKLDPTVGAVVGQDVDSAFEKVYGIDRDQNACEAAKLSLSLLHLVLEGRYPNALNLLVGDALQLFEDGRNSEFEDIALGTFDLVVANPPFVSVESQRATGIRERLASFLGPHSFGRSDLYLAFILLALRLLKPGGLGLFVVPQSFLVSSTAARMRRELVSATWIRALVDLSAIPVFQGVGAYVALIVFERKSDATGPPPTAQILKCRGQVGQALQDLVDGRRADNRDYEIFELGQDVFEDSEWVLAPPASQLLRTKLRRLPRLGDFLEARQGVVTGCDSVFIRPLSAVPRGERKVWPPLLRDREISQYRLPARSEFCCFFPWHGDEKLSAGELKGRFPETWKYLLKSKATLQRRKGLDRYGRSWWEPLWAREPRVFFSPKIVTPHLVLLPRFSLDLAGKYLISHAPVLLGRGDGTDPDLLKFFVAVLNSSVSSWLLNSQARRYRSGYVAVESTALKNLPVPDPGTVPPATMRGIVSSVNALLAPESTPTAEGLEALDQAIADVFCLSDDDRSAVGLGPSR